jgi:hypothetical protein
MNGSHWTDAEDNVVIAAYANTRRLAEVAAELGRTRNAVIARANRLGLSSMENFEKVVASDWYQKINKAHAGKPKELDWDRIIALAQYANTHGEIAGVIGCTKQAVGRILYKHGVLLRCQVRALLFLEPVRSKRLNHRQLGLANGQWMQMLVRRGLVSLHPVAYALNDYQLTEHGMTFLTNNGLLEKKAEYQVWETKRETSADCAD